MLHPAYIRLIHDQKERELLTAIEMKQRCQAGFACQFPATPWYARFARIFSREQSVKGAPSACCPAK